MKDKRVAVIGVGCWYPGSSSILHLWENILARRQQFRRIPVERFPLEEYGAADPRAEDRTYLTRAAFIDGFAFDWLSRSIPRSTVEGADTAHWLALEVALTAMEDAGHTANTLPKETTGVIVGNSLTGAGQRRPNDRCASRHHVACRPEAAFDGSREGPGPVHDEIAAKGTRASRAGIQGETNRHVLKIQKAPSQRVVALVEGLLGTEDQLEPIALGECRKVGDVVQLVPTTHTIGDLIGQGRSKFDVDPDCFDVLPPSRDSAADTMTVGNTADIARRPDGSAILAHGDRDGCRAERSQRTACAVSARSKLPHAFRNRIGDRGTLNGIEEVLETRAAFQRDGRRRGLGCHGEEVANLECHVSARSSPTSFT